MCDGEYSCTSQLALIKAQLVSRVLGESDYFSKIVQDVVDEIIKVAERGSVSHIVIYGKNRIRVMASILCGGRIIGMVPIILSEKLIEKERLIAQRIDNQLSLDAIRALPDVLDFPGEASLMAGLGLLEKLYVSGRLLQPYQIDTDRFPFSRRYI